MRRLCSEIWTRDNALHAMLGFALMAAFSGAGMVPGWIEGALVAGSFLFLREVTQVQCKYHGNDFRKGWLLDLHHTMEWLVPTVSTLVMAYAIEVLS